MISLTRVAPANTEMIRCAVALFAAIKHSGICGVG